MKNSMAKSMTQRYEEYLHTSKLEERGGKNIYYWVMSTMESIFWGLGRITSFEIDLYASEKEILLLYIHPSGKEYEFEYHHTLECGNGKLTAMLQNFVEIFNNIDYPLSKKISSPVFNAYYLGVCDNRGKYDGFEHVRINVHMLPDDDIYNHGRH